MARARRGARAASWRALISGALPKPPPPPSAAAQRLRAANEPVARRGAF